MEAAAAFLKFIWGLLKSDTAHLGMAGIAGAVAAAMVEWSGWLHLLRKVVVGCLCAIYLSELMVPLLSVVLAGLSLPAGSSIELSAFLMGMLGIVIVEFFTHLFASYRNRGAKPATLVDPSNRDK